MPYKDPERKKEWERLHRIERLARRRELRQTKTAEHQTEPVVEKVECGGRCYLFP